MHNKWQDSFLQEADDLLAEIEECALALNESTDSSDTIGQLFRGFHTIKGSGAMCGFSRVAGFTHHIETLLDEVREGRIESSPRVAELVLASADHIRSLLAAETGRAAEPTVRSEDLIATLDQFLASRDMAALAAASSAKPEHSVAAVSGERDWQITFRPSPDLFKRGGNPLLLLRDLRQLGTAEVTPLVDTLPALEDLDAEGCYLGFTMRLRTQADENAIRDVFLFTEDGAQLTIEALNGAPTVESLNTPQSAPMTTPVSDASGEAEERKSGGGTAGKTSGKDSVVRVPAARLDRLVNLVGELVMNQSRLAQATMHCGTAELANPVQEMERLVAELRDDVLGIRMLPIGTIFGRFRRLVHDLSQELGKEVDLVTEGAETELDKSILDQLGEPLVHLLRNSIDHGVEPADERQAKGKPRRGRIRLAAVHTGANVMISIEDDGRGVNREAVRAKAISRNLIAADAVLSDKELLNLILLPGFSTAQKLTSVSGRGVGMDVVKKQIDALCGTLTIASEEGRGTRMALSLPLTLAIIEGLIVQIGADQFIIPMAAITENVELDRAQRARKNGRNVVVVRGELIPYIDLRATFQMEGEPPAIEKVVIVRHEEERVGLVVDRVLGTHQTVLQSLGRFLRKIDVVSGATILGDGRVALILDIGAVVRFVEREKRPGTRILDPAERVPVLASA